MSLFRTNLTEAFSDEGADKIRAAARQAKKDGQRYSVTFKKDGRRVDWDIKIKGNRIMGKPIDLVDPNDMDAMVESIQKKRGKKSKVDANNNSLTDYL